MEYTPKTWTEDDVEISITHCGVCGSDVHTLSAGWGEAKLPLIVGHEIVGTAVRVGTNVPGISVGDRVGVGAMIHSCLNCRACKTDNESYCPDNITTYVSSRALFDPLRSFPYSTLMQLNNRTPSTLMVSRLWEGKFGYIADGLYGSPH